MIEPTDKNSKTNQVNTSGGANTEGNVEANQFVGRDQHVYGDEVHGDKIAGHKITTGDRGVAARQIDNSVIVTGDENKVIVQRLDPTDARNQRNHKVMRQIVRSFWIDGVLKHSLYHEVLIRLNLQEQVDVVNNQFWNSIQYRLNQPDRQLPPNTPIINIFDQMNQQLLILGEPGSGKTTSLLELARDLLARAELDPTYSTPVVINLSSWVEPGHTLEQWLVNEVCTKYNIPRKLITAWIAQDELLLMLDGLDEVRADQRDGCVKAINQFLQEHLVPIVVCSRVIEYTNLGHRLNLHGAVLLQPLTFQQIDTFLSGMGERLTPLRMLLQDEKIRELLQFPLLLVVMSMIYHNRSIEEIHILDSSALQLKPLFNTYIGLMLRRPSRLHTQPYHHKQTIYWLSSLARMMLNQGETIFLIEQIQPRLLLSRTLRWVYAISSRLFFGSLVGLFYLLLSDSDDAWYRALSAGGGLGLGIGLVDALRFELTERKLKTRIDSLFWTIGLYAVGTFLLTGFISGLFYGLASGFRFGLTIGLLGGVTTGIVSGNNRIAEEIQTFEAIRLSWAEVTKGGTVGVITGALIGLSGGVIGLLYIPVALIQPLDILVLTCIGGFSAGIGLALSSLVAAGNVENKSIPNQGIWLTLRNASIAAIIAGLTAGISTEFMNKLTSGLMGVLGDILTFGLIDQHNVGISCGLIAILITFIRHGGHSAGHHFFLRLMLWWQRLIPWNYARFLDYSVDRIFLRRIGGGYIFIHRMLMEHFASLTDEDIERIASDVEARKKV